MKNESTTKEKTEYLNYLNNLILNKFVLHATES